MTKEERLREKFIKERNKEYEDYYSNCLLDIVKFEEKWLKDAKGNNPNTDIAFSGIMAKVAKLPPTRKKGT